ncbi:copper chaperone PCu(A)C [Rhodococcus triatomae]|uniref:Copper chaperone PCu(A)C n=1 Tax=Rhodococcus triatomae TaxID=300028 RepID=A0A1G8AWW3_9NOCA|nr:copper chaperone PCu(A)C [Rhodococcus triatomae]QNG17649.1 copper chaperone PCu(A)C [Rhodococcus triatomae]QNG22684.1 copper chaperone PCu(A)C [Rhodococcus triatomae]SDH25485.1 hypothetical protein SAMN05444695_101568 [Rhodococcus triatomae]
MTSKYFRTSALGVAILAGVALAGCGTDSDPQENTARAADAITVAAPWVKAAETGMTGAFADFTNTGDRDIRIVAVDSPASARGELHEMATGDAGTPVMREVEDGFLVPTGDTRSLEPGADHIMLMELTAPLIAGSDTDITVTFDDGSSTTFSAQVRDFAGNREEYAPGHGN